MELNLRKVSDFANCSIEHDGTTIDLGFIDNKDAKQLLQEFQEAVATLEWFVACTSKG